MAPPDTVALAEQLLGVTQALATRLLAEDVTAVETLARQRETLIADLIAAPLRADEAERVTIAIRRILDLERAMIARLEVDKATVRDELGRVLAVRRSLASYGGAAPEGAAVIEIRG